MITKLFEVRDHGTMIQCFATQMASPAVAEQLLLGASGYGSDPDEKPLVLIGNLSGNQCHYDPYHWGDRTWSTAHVYIQGRFDQLKSGQVIDVRYILGEVDAPCKSNLIHPHFI